MGGLHVDFTGIKGAFHFQLFGRDLFILKELMYVGIALLAVLLIAILIGNAAKKQDARQKPSPILVCAEWLWNFTQSDVDELSSSNPKEHKMMLHNYAINIFLLIFIMNTMSLWGIHSPASNIFISSALGVLVFILVHGLGIAGGLGQYLKKYMQPNVVFLPINIITAASEIISIAMRLFGNTLAASTLSQLLRMAFMIIPIPGVGPITYPLFGALLMCYDIFIAYIQALLFMRLSMTYIREKLPIEHEA